MGAGVQSTTMLLMACHGEITPKPDLVIFSDTGWEPRNVYRHLEWLKAEVKKFGVEIITVTNGNIREDIFNAVNDSTRFASLPFFTLSTVPIYEYEEEDEFDEDQVLMFDDLEFETVDKKAIGYKEQKGMVRRQCTREYKIHGVQQGVRRHLGYEKGQRVKELVHMWKGISTDEIQRMDMSRDRWIEFRYPLIEQDMSRQACLDWMEAKGYPAPPKSSCIGCPFHNDAMWLDMKTNDPESWNDAVLVDNVIKQLPRFKGKAFLHRSCKPLAEVDFNENQMLIDNFVNECSGSCGV
ncbi:hypothetical protein OB236_38420 [Paenibacillus sp. WQ 127069]|uniref:Phosphoadenosine phosphosulphate reductase domain-containing protein n=1 Tax=Paenibacillus baimaensis TaxID=2982185 RepID=A0ABT2UTP8_9BACL|nr:hypothetical protein [Paenibacillus sp. WQ 127069]